MPSANDPAHQPAYIALGSNLGDRAAHLAFGRARLAGLPLTALIGVSTIEETAPLGAAAQPPYLNQMVLLDTALDPWALLAACHQIEQDAGRVRRERWASRTLDLDIVLFGELEWTDPALSLPHPGLGERDFWRRELAELRSHER